MNPRQASKSLNLVPCPTAKPPPHSPRHKQKNTSLIHNHPQQQKQHAPTSPAMTAKTCAPPPQLQKNNATSAITEKKHARSPTSRKQLTSHNKKRNTLTTLVSSTYGSPLHNRLEVLLTKVRAFEDCEQCWIISSDIIGSKLHLQASAFLDPEAVSPEIYCIHELALTVRIRVRLAHGSLLVQALVISTQLCIGIFGSFMHVRLGSTTAHGQLDHYFGLLLPTL